MEFPICNKHKKVQKSIQRVNNNAYVCMNRYCPDAFKVFCSGCKTEHRDHQIKILSIEDTIFLLERMQKMPFKDTNRYLMESVDVMKKLKLIKQFRKKIDILQKQMQKEVLKLINCTQLLLDQFNICREGVNSLSDVLGGIEKAENYQYFFNNSQQLLGSMDYNFKKDKFQYGNLLTKEKEDKRRKNLDITKRKIQEVRDYSMKIIQVILNNCESDSQEQDNKHLYKHYDVLKNELFLDKNQEELDEQISDLKNSKSTSNISRIKKNCLDHESQTSDATKIADVVSQYEEKIKDLQYLHEVNQSQLKLELRQIQNEKQDLKKKFQDVKVKYMQKRQAVKEIYQSLRETKTQKQRKQKVREQKVSKLINLWQWKGLTSDDRLQ